MIQRARQAGLGAWIQLGNQAQRLQIVGLLGHHKQVLTDVAALRDHMAEIPEQPADNDLDNPWVVRETILGTGRFSAMALGRLQQKLDLTNEVIDNLRRRGASAYAIARTRFNNYYPLLALGCLNEAEHILRDYQEVSETTNDITAVVSSHHNLASFLVFAPGTSAEQRAHRLVAALLGNLIGDTHQLANAPRMLAHELRSDTDTPDAPAPPTTLSEVIRLVDAGDGVHFDNLVAVLVPDPGTADRALADLLATAATFPDQPAESLLTD